MSRSCTRQTLLVRYLPSSFTIGRGLLQKHRLFLFLCPMAGVSERREWKGRVYMKRGEPLSSLGGFRNARMPYELLCCTATAIFLQQRLGIPSLLKKEHWGRKEKGGLRRIPTYNRSGLHITPKYSIALSVRNI